MLKIDMQVTRYSDDVMQAQRTHGGIMHQSVMNLI